MQTRDIILTGLPRSGTTLTVKLLNQVQNVVGLHEPMSFTDVAGPENKSAGLDYVTGFFERERREILASGTACTHHINGMVPDNHMSKQYGGNGLRQANISRERIKIDKKLTDDFYLVIKHPAAFTALLEVLLPYYSCYAIIRNPLAVLASWNSVNLPVQDGRAYVAEKFDQALSHALREGKGRMERQLHLLAWWFNKYLTLLPRERIIKYENIVASGGKTLSVIVADAEDLDEKLESKNMNELYDQGHMKYLVKQLMEQDGPYWKFYSKEETLQLVNDWS